MATLRQLESAVRKRYGKRAYVQHHPTAKDKAGREAISARIREIKQRLDEIRKDGSTDAVRDSWKSLKKAAEFVVDTDGDRSAVEALRAPVAAAAVLADRLAEQSELLAERKALEAGRHREPYDVWQPDSIGFCTVYQCGGDTIDEVLAKVRADQAVRA